MIATFDGDEIGLHRLGLQCGIYDLAHALILAGEVEEAERRFRPMPAALHASRSVYLAQSLIEQRRTDEAHAVVTDDLRLFPENTRFLDQTQQLSGDI